MNLADRIREMSLMVDRISIAESLQVPIDLVDGVLSGTVNDDALLTFDTARNKETLVVEKRILTRGKVIMTIQHSPLAATMALSLSKITPVAVVDLEQYPSVPTYLGMAIKDLPRFVNLLWDNAVSNNSYTDNLYIYQMPSGELNTNAVNEVLKKFQTVIVNCSEANWFDLAPYADVIYITQLQNQIGLHKLYQIFARSKTFEEKSQVIWIGGPHAMDQTQCLKILRGFSNVMVAGEIPEMFLKISPQEHSRAVSDILGPLFPALKRKRNGVISKIKGWME